MTNASKNRSVVHLVDQGFGVVSAEAGGGLVDGVAVGRLAGEMKLVGRRRGGGRGGKGGGKLGVDKVGTDAAGGRAAGTGAGGGGDKIGGGGDAGRDDGGVGGGVAGGDVDGGDVVGGGVVSGRRNSERKRAAALEVERRRLLVEERKRRAELDRVRAMKPPRLWGMQASIRKMRTVMGEAVSIESVLGVWRSPEALEAMPRVQRVKLAQAAKLARRLRAGLMQSVCSSSWMETCMHGAGVPAYPPVADSLNCRMVRVRDMDHLADRLLAGQSRRRMVPAIYTSARGFSYDVIYEQLELYRRRLMRELDMPVVRRVAAYYQQANGKYSQVEEED